MRKGRMESPPGRKSSAFHLDKKPVSHATPKYKESSKPEPKQAAQKQFHPKPHFGKTAKKAGEQDDRPLKHGSVSKKHKNRQRLEQMKI